MMGATASEQCDFCGGKAVAFQRGARVCGSCGTRRTLSEHPALQRRSQRRGPVVGLLSSSLFLVVMAGSAALAAIGGLAAVLDGDATNLEATEATVASVQLFDSSQLATDTPPADLTEGEITEIVDDAQQQADRAHAHAAAVQEWADCISNIAGQRIGAQLDPMLECGTKPSAAAFGLDNENGAEDGAPNNEPQ